MAKGKNKTNFIGLKVTPEEAALLEDVKDSLGLSTKTEVLVKGLLLMAEMRQPGVGRGSYQRDSDNQIATREEIVRLEAEIQRNNAVLENTRSKTREVIMAVVQELSKADEIISKYEGDGSALIQVLLELQRENRWLSPEVLRWVSRKLNVPLNQVYHVATFYKAFSLLPRGRHLVSVCLGTACQVRGAPRLLDRAVEIFKTEAGETSADMRFSLETVNCLGCCALGPVMVVDGKYYGKPSTKEIEQVAAACE